MHELLAEYEGAFFELLRELQELRSASVIATVAHVGQREKQLTIPPSLHRLEANVFDIFNDGEGEPQYHNTRDVGKLHQEEYESTEKLVEDSARQRETSGWASPTTDYASVQRAAAMSTPLPASLAAGLHRQGQVLQSAPLPGLPSSFPATAQQRRRGWLGWVFGGGGERPPKKRVRNALV